MTLILLLRMYLSKQLETLSQRVIYCHTAPQTTTLGASQLSRLTDTKVQSLDPFPQCGGQYCGSIHLCSSKIAQIFRYDLSVGPGYGAFRQSVE